jgi:uncharacterized protein
LLNAPLPDAGIVSGQVQNRFIALLKQPFKSSEDYPDVGCGERAGARAKRTVTGRKQGSAPMARFEILDSNVSPLGEGPAAGDMLFELGMMYSIGREVPIDLISAHKWFNLAAAKGNAEATRLRREIADQMSDVEIASAQRAARDWLTAH